MVLNYGQNCFLLLTLTTYMKCSELMRLLKSDGWFVVRQEGSHVMMRHSIKDGQLVVPNYDSKEVKKGLLAALLKMAEIKTDKR